MGRAADYVYRTTNDRIRIRIFKSEVGWDFDVFTRGGDVYRYTAQGAVSPFGTKRAAKEEAEMVFGNLVSIQPKSNVTEGW